MATNKRSSTQAGNAGDPDSYAGKKDEYGGTMTGTGYGKQARKSKEAERGFEQGQGQGSGYDDEKNRDAKEPDQKEEYEGQSSYGQGYTMGNRSGRTSSDQGAGTKKKKMPDKGKKE